MLIRINALAITATLLVGHPASASADMRNPDTSRLGVRLVNHAGVSNAVLSVARDEASRIFLAAGVIVNWREPTTSGVSATHIHLGVMLIPEASDGDSRRRNVLGRAVLTPTGSGHIVYAFYGAIERQARATRTDAAVVLGHVMAHEMGHLLLGRNAHSLAGIMRSNWNDTLGRRAGEGSLTFTNDQAEKIRMNVSAR